MPLQRMKKFLRLKVNQLTEWQRIERKQSGKRKKGKKEKRRQKTPKSSGGGRFHNYL